MELHKKIQNLISFLFPGDSETRAGIMFVWVFLFFGGVLCVCFVGTCARVIFYCNHKQPSSKLFIHVFIYIVHIICFFTFTVTGVCRGVASNIFGVHAHTLWVFFLFLIVV